VLAPAALKPAAVERLRRPMAISAEEPAATVGSCRRVDK
jgi:hypothetical protein